MLDGGHHETEDIMNAITMLTVPILALGAMLVSADLLVHSKRLCKEQL
jgi:hypothetical protein